MLMEDCIDLIENTKYIRVIYIGVYLLLIRQNEYKPL